MYDEQEWFLDMWHFNVKNDIYSTTWAFYYDDWFQWTWDITLKYNNKYYSKLWRIITSSWYVWLMSWWWQNFNLWYIKLSNDTKENNSHIPNHIEIELTPYWLQSSTWYWVWVDRNGYINWNWKINSETTINFFTWTTAWKPMPFDTDWDALYEKKEALYFWNSNDVDDVDADWLTNWKKDWDSDNDWWSDGEEFRYSSNMKDSNTRPSDNWSLQWSSSGNYLADIFENLYFGNWDCAWLNWANDDCDWDGLTNREEQQAWTNPKVIDSNSNWITDFEEYIFWLLWKDSSSDSDFDKLKDFEEIRWFDISYSIIDSLWQNIVFSGHLVTDPYNFDTDTDWINDYTEIFVLNTNPLKWDTDWDGIIDWQDPDPKNALIPWNDIDYSDLDNDWLPKWWEDKYTNWRYSKWSSSDNVIVTRNWEISATWSYALDDTNDDSDDDVILDSYEDFDEDWLINIYEYFYNTNPNNWDTDWDGISDYDEIKHWLDPNNPADAHLDNDWDWLSNIEEINWIDVTINYINTNWDAIVLNKISYTDPNDADTDGDRLNDKWEIDRWIDAMNLDTDWDWSNDWIEIAIQKMDPTKADPLDWTIFPIDSDNDWLPDFWEEYYTNWNHSWSSWNVVTRSWSLIASWISFSLDINSNNSDSDSIFDPFEDFDQDWLSNLDELFAWTNPNNWDTDWDGISDYDEIKNWLDPNSFNDWNLDNDWDWLSNYEEITWRTITLTYIDTEWDLITLTKTVYTNPNNADTDWDWLNDKWEIENWLDPTNLDVDWDWSNDWIEVAIQKINPAIANPLNWTIFPPDSDQDWLPDFWEEYYTNWKHSWSTWNIITENWDLNASWISYYLDINNANSDNDAIFDPFEDFDLDWLNNLEELLKWTNPNNWDTDWDGISDSFDPFPLDYCNWADICIIWIPTDRDYDTISDKDEILWFSWNIIINWILTEKKIFTIWTNYDTDNDWLSDWYEWYHDLDPVNNDNDIDNWLDWAEVTVSNYHNMENSNSWISALDWVKSNMWYWEFSPSITQDNWVNFFSDFFNSFLDY